MDCFRLIEPAVPALVALPSDHTVIPSTARDLSGVTHECACIKRSLAALGMTVWSATAFA
jgi:hypothetical protein